MPYSLSGIPIVSSRWLYAAMCTVSMLLNAANIILISVGLNTRPYFS